MRLLQSNHALFKLDLRVTNGIVRLSAYIDNRCDWIGALNWSAALDVASRTGLVHLRIKKRL